MCQSTTHFNQPLSQEAIEAERKRLQQALHDGGYALTSQRAAVYDVLLETNDHICAEHILESIRRKHPSWRVNKTTIYRTLDLLLALGIIYEMKRDDGRAQYEPAYRGPHGHLICRQCGELQDLVPAAAASFRAALSAKCGFDVDIVGHAFPGICQRCARTS